ncbi:glycosyltransferase family 1 protein [Enterovirga rhinocerotis]|uniref:glycosyltransferase family 1 protein n=1 Tax=Enterovirga rhinocerotis TaxID=1339210 RepID=UPI001FE23D80|nr:glycosyltransferase family 1 protein [Enterovirga rhinocerotis]
MVCFSHLRWDFVWQRPQHLLTRAAASFNVLFVEEPIFKADALPRLDLRKAGPVTVAVPVLPSGLSERETADRQRKLLDGLLQSGGGDPAVLWYYTPMAMPFSDHLSAEVVVYDNMDELSAFRGASPAMLAKENELLARADLIFTGGISLYEAKRHRHPDIRPFPSSVDEAHFAAARPRRGPQPADQESIPAPRLGFYGVIDERFDMPLLEGLAALRPDWHFIMVGPVLKIDPATLPRRPNIHWLGQKAYEDLPAYLSGWDVGLMPFALNEATRFISPTKTLEFLAAGLPVISTPIRDVVRPYGEKRLVQIARTPREFVAAAEKVMGRADPAWIAEVDRHLASTSWDLTWAAMGRLIADELGRPAPRLTPAPPAVAAAR